MGPENHDMTDAAAKDDLPVAKPVGRPRPRPKPGRVTRWTLLLVGALLAGVFAVAIYLDPYDADGKPRTMATHTQLGMPPCNFVILAGRPCPSCGMTTSFALLVHGDLMASLRANWSGTLLAGWLAVMLPWTALSAVRGRWLGGRAVEAWLLWGVIGIVGLVALRWVAVIGVPWLCGFG